MASKYSQLPDLDPNPIDIYESADIVEVSLITEKSHSQESRRSSIDSETIPLAQASQIFSTSDIDSSHTDFSEKIGSESKSYAIRGITESLDGRIARLRRELLEVEAECRQIGQQDKPHDLRHILDRLKVEQESFIFGGFNSELKGEDESGVDAIESIHKSQEATPVEAIETSREAYTTKSQSSLQSATSRILTLEAKLTDIEKVLGPFDLETSSNLVESKPIAQTLTDLRLKLGLLTSNPKALETSTENLKLLAARLEMIRNLKLRTSTTDISDLSLNIPSERLYEIYTQLPTLTRLSSLVPRVINRLKTLNQIHIDAASSIQLVKTVDTTIQSINSELRAWKGSLNAIEEKIQTHEVKSRQNELLIEEWIKELEIKQQKGPENEE